jgi:hypothetical protein
MPAGRLSLPNHEGPGQAACPGCRTTFVQPSSRAADLRERPGFGSAHRLSMTNEFGRPPALGGPCPLFLPGVIFIGPDQAGHLIVNPIGTRCPASQDDTMISAAFNLLPVAVRALVLADKAGASHRHPCRRPETV